MPYKPCEGTVSEIERKLCPKRSTQKMKLNGRERRQKSDVAAVTQVRNLENSVEKLRRKGLTKRWKNRAKSKMYVFMRKKNER